VDTHRTSTSQSLAQASFIRDSNRVEFLMDQQLDLVSIRTRRLSRVNPLLADTSIQVAPSFNPHPAVKPGESLR
jgi:hypothetical protein